MPEPRTRRYYGCVQYKGMSISTLRPVVMSEGIVLGGIPLRTCLVRAPNTGQVRSVGMLQDMSLLLVDHHIASSSYTAVSDACLAPTIFLTLAPF
jgi:hypothetical protein